MAQTRKRRNSGQSLSSKSKKPIPKSSLAGKINLVEKVALSITAIKKYISLSKNVVSKLEGSSFTKDYPFKLYLSDYKRELSTINREISRFSNLPKLNSGSFLYYWEFQCSVLKSNFSYIKGAISQLKTSINRLKMSALHAENKRRPMVGLALLPITFAVGKVPITLPIIKNARDTERLTSNEVIVYLSG